MVEIVFAAGVAARITLAVEGRSHPGSDEPYDRDWLAARASVAVGGFAGRSAGLVRAGDFPPFLAALERLNRSLRGRADFETLEGWFALRLTGDGLGHVGVEGELKDGPAGAQALRFGFELDQTALAAPLAALAAVVARFPPLADGSG